jgi:hypothetical protein
VIKDLKRIWRLNSHNWRSDGNWYLSYRSALWIRLKATVCVLLGWWDDDGDYDDWFILARYNCSTWPGEYGTHRGWDELTVKVSGWAIAERSDSTP